MDNHITHAPERTRTARKIRHEIRVRTLCVARVEPLAPNMVRVVLTGNELEGFTSLGFDDHVKMFFPEPGTDVPNLPLVGPNGIYMPEGMAKPMARDYTVRRFDAEHGELHVDFALHEAGPATRWALNAQPGNAAWIAGPRGSFIVPTDFDWHLMIGDETALPAIARRLEELPAGTRALALIEVEDALNELPLPTRADARILWLHRGNCPAGNADGFLAAIDAMDWPQGDYHAWISCETTAAKAIRAHLIATKGGNPKWMRASGYWRRGEEGMHDHLDD